MGSPATAYFPDSQLSKAPESTPQPDSAASQTNCLRKAPTLAMFPPSVIANVLVLLTTIGSPIIASAQAQEVGPNERLKMLFGDLQSVEPLQIVAPGLILDDVKFVSLQGSIVRLEEVVTGKLVDVSLSAIRSIAIEQDHRLKATLWGTTGGMLVGSVFGLMVGSFKCSDLETCLSDERAGAVRWGTALGLVGGGAGFVLGRRSRYWEAIFP